MPSVTAYAYMQSRVQSRHGLRPSAQVWQHLAGQQDLGNYLQLARRTELRPWVLGLHSSDSPHQLESALRRQLLDYIQDSAFWLPRPWRQAILWVQCLLDLPAVQFLLQGNNAPRWMLEDPRLRAHTLAGSELRMQTLQQSIYRPLVDAWQQQQALPLAWLRHWQSLWPRRAAGGHGELLQLIYVLQQHLQDFGALAPSQTWPQRRALVRKLEFLFRRCSFHPAALFTHLALVALDCERLRADLLGRQLFPRYESERP